MRECVFDVKTCYAHQTHYQQKQTISVILFGVVAISRTTYVLGQRQVKNLQQYSV